jgi:hypothetical protein
MTNAQEVLSYIRVLVWPTVVLVAVLLFRPQLAKLIGRITEVSAAGALVKFSEEVDQLVDKADSLRREVAGIALVRSEARPNLDSLPLPEEPIASFLAAYRELEVAARDAAPAAGGTSPLLIPVLKGLQEQTLVPESAVEVGEELRSIRNQVAHGFQRLTPDDAQGLVAAARSLNEVIRTAAQSSGQR